MKASLYKVTCVISNLCYYGIVYKEGKTFLDRWEEHKNGKGGKFLYQAIQEHGADNFTINLIEEGEFDYISQREREESTYTQYYNGTGYNGNIGHAIYNSPNTIKQMIANRDEQGRVHKWQETIKRKSGDIEWVEARRASKSEAMKKRWEEPTTKMVAGKIKESLTKTGRRNRQHSEWMSGRFIGVNNSNFKFWWVTPDGTFETLNAIEEFYHTKKVSGIKSLCKVPGKMITKTIAKNGNLKSDLIGMTAIDAGFTIIKV